MSDMPTKKDFDRMIGMDQRQLVTFTVRQTNELLALIKDAKAQTSVYKKPMLAMEALNAATDLIAEGQYA